MLHSLFPLFVHKYLLLEIQDVHSYERGQSNENGIDEIEIEGSGCVKPVARGQSETGRTEGRHDGCGYGYAGNDVTSALPRAT